MLDRNSKEIRLNQQVQISKATLKKFKLTIDKGTVVGCGYNTEQLVVVETTEDLYDLHAKSLTVID